jgi:hypothetical protein
MNNFKSFLWQPIDDKSHQRNSRYHRRTECQGYPDVGSSRMRCGVESSSALNWRGDFEAQAFHITEIHKHVCSYFCPQEQATDCRWQFWK